MRASADDLGPVALLPPEVLSRAVSDGKRLGMQLTYSDGASSVFRSAGAVWLPPRRMWVIEAASADEALNWMRSVLGAGDSFDGESARALLSTAVSAADGSFFTRVLDTQIFSLAAGEGVAVTSHYDTYIVRAMKALGGRFHSAAKAWQVRRSSEHVVRALREVAGIEEEFVFLHETEVVLEHLAAPLASSAPITVPAASPEWTAGSASREDQDGSRFITTRIAESEAINVMPSLLKAHTATAGLRDYQEAGVAHMVRQTGSCLADDMGLGKSRQTVVAAAFIARVCHQGRSWRTTPGRVLLICPASLRINWEREIKAVYPDASVGMVGDDRMETLYTCEWVIASYERLGGLVRETRLSFAVMAADEAHYLKEHDIGRTRNAFLLAARTPRCIVVTGTPLLNREVELHTLLRLTGHHLGLLTLKEFRERFTGGGDKRDALAAELRGWMLRRSKGELKELGTKQRQLRWIEPTEGMKPYRDLWNDMSLQQMPKLGKLRQCLEAMKIDFMLETVESMSEGDKIIIFVQYLSTVQILMEEISRLGVNAVCLTGADSSGRRQAAVDRFQLDSTCRVFVTTFAAGGVGITLTAGNLCLIGSPPWTPAQLRQAEDRAYRMGQKRDVRVIVPLIPKTIDEQVWKLVDSKTQLEQEVVEASVIRQMAR